MTRRRTAAREALAALPPDPNVRIFFQPENRGKGAAVRRGFAEAAGDVVVVQDADLEYDPQDYHKLLEPILSGRADVVYGSRFPGWPRRVLRFRHQLANRFLTLLSNLVTDLNLTDMLQDDDPRGREELATAFGPLRHRTGNHRQDRAPRLSGLRGAGLVSRARLLGREENLLEGRRRRSLDDLSLRVRGRRGERAHAST